MIIEDANIAYIKASKTGKDQYMNMLSKGQSGYLPSLERIIKNTNIDSEKYLGLIEIPLEKIVGTYFFSRANIFASNFMPILDKNSEFKDKWVHLYQSHIEEGIREPIKVYEYLNWFYVLEGNKRVSVLKFIDAYSFHGNVTRIIPKYDPSNKTICNYYKFMEFQKITSISSIWFSNEKSFDELTNYFDNYTPDLSIYSNKFKHFENYVYKPFRNLYKKSGGDNLPITTGDAILEYIKLYGIPQEFIEDKNITTIENLIKELEAININPQIKVLSEPLAQPKKNMLKSLTNLVTPKRKLKIGFIYYKDVNSWGLTYAQESARRFIQEKYKDEILTEFIENVPSDDNGYIYIEKLVKNDCKIIFTTDPIYKNITLKAALNFPDVKFLNCAEGYSFKHVINYYARIYEASFLIGLIAGSLTNSNVIGYIADYPVREIIPEINAFTLGVQTVNPKGKVHVYWSYDEQNISNKDNIRNKLKNKNCDIVFYHAIPVPGDAKHQYGLCSLDYTGTNEESLMFSHFANMILLWENFYENFINITLSAGTKSLFEVWQENSKLINYWLGIDSGIVDIIFSNKFVPHQTQKLVKLFRKMIIRKDYHPFTGPIFDQQNNLKIEENIIASYDDLLNMTWFVKGIVGDIPDTIKHIRKDQKISTLIIEK
ncbi:BMP family ABC transporter substrate-binding protein [Clostridium sp. DL1XJH146]